MGPAGLYRCDGRLFIKASRVVLRGEGPGKTRLYFTSHKGMAHKAHIAVGKAPYIHAKAALLKAPTDPLRLDAKVNPAAKYSAGDDVVIGWEITDGFVDDHGMSGTWKSFNGTWQVFFQRTLTEDVSDGVFKLDVPLRMLPKLRDKPSVAGVTLLAEIGIESLAVGNAVKWNDAWQQNQVHAIGLRGVKDSWVRDVHSFDPPFEHGGDEGFAPGAHLQSGGIRVDDSKRVTIADCHMQRAQHRGGGGNGYLFDVRRSSEVLVRDCVGEHGRHNFIQNWGFGTSGCVFLRTTSRGGKAQLVQGSEIGSIGLSEFHHSLAMANLIDDSTADDGWGAVNRGDWSSGAGHTATENVFWRLRGKGQLQSYQFGVGYVIGTGADLQVWTKLSASTAKGTAPEDYREGLGLAQTLEPKSLYQAQLAARLAPRKPGP